MQHSCEAIGSAADSVVKCHSVTSATQVTNTESNVLHVHNASLVDNEVNGMYTELCANVMRHVPAFPSPEIVESQIPASQPPWLGGMLQRRLSS